MKHLLNTLYVTTPKSYLCREGETVQIRVGDEMKLRVPVHTLGGIICFGQISCSPQLMQLCAENNVMISFLSEQGQFYARVQGEVNGNVLLRREQYRRADEEVGCAEIARVIVAAKIANSRTVLLRAMRDHPEHSDTENVHKSAERMARLLDGLELPAPLDTVRGREGDAAHAYFGVFNNLITAQKEAFNFRERSRRPPLDNINALLSFVYTLLMHDVSAACEAVGLDPAVGFLHRDRPGRPGLALDIMEEFRAYLADRLVLSLVNRRQIQAKQFITTETGAVRMEEDARKEILIAYQKRKQEEILHPFLGEKMAIGLLPHVQTLLLARYLRGDLDAYPPFIWR